MVNGPSPICCRLRPQKAKSGDNGQIGRSPGQGDQFLRMYCCSDCPAAWARRTSTRYALVGDLPDLDRRHSAVLALLDAGGGAKRGKCLRPAHLHFVDNSATLSHLVATVGATNDSRGQHVDTSNTPSHRAGSGSGGTCGLCPGHGGARQRRRASPADPQKPTPATSSHRQPAQRPPAHRPWPPAPRRRSVRPLSQPAPPPCQYEPPPAPQRARTGLTRTTSRMSSAKLRPR